MLAIKIDRFDNPGCALNETVLGPIYGIGRRARRAGFHLMKARGILSRRQTGHRTFAAETRAPHSNNHFVMVERTWLTEPSEVVAFIMVINASPFPQRPAEACKRFGITSKGARLKVVTRAIKLEAIAHHVGPGGGVTVARKGHIFDRFTDVPATDVPATNVPTQKKQTKLHSRQEELKKNRQRTTATRGPAGLAAADAEQKDHCLEEVAKVAGRSQTIPSWC